MTGATKTNAARLLEARGIEHRVRVYDAGGAFHSADEAAALLGAPGGSVLKTLVLLRETTGRAKPLLVLVPSDRQVDLKRVGHALGEKRPRMATQREAERLTGLKVGGISALAVRAGAFEVLVDRSAAGWERVHVSAGVRGVDLEIGLGDLLAVTGGRLVDASRAAAEGRDEEEASG
ncbi:MAG TPA: YbaK/EbsC family protein [Methylomirabilota bacterium]